MRSPNVLFALSLLRAQTAVPTLAEIEARAKTFPGVEMSVEMQSPSVVPMTFRFSNRGRYRAKYPTSEMFITPTQTITWMPDRKEYAKAPNTEGSPLPLGFHSMWPGAKPYRQFGEAEAAEFGGKKCFRLVCQGSEPYKVNLFVDAETQLPLGKRVTFNGTTYEMLYKSVKIGVIADDLLSFRPPKGAKPAGQHRPDEMLIKPGARLLEFSGRDLTGRTLSAARLRKQNDRGMVLNFWFSSCVGCVQEMPYLAKLGPRLAAQKVGLIGVNPVDDASSARRTAQKNALPYPTLIGPGANALKRQVSVEAYPVTVILDAKSTVVDAFMGFDESRLKTGLSRLGVKL